jgi:hypothetical protein
MHSLRNFKVENGKYILLQGKVSYFIAGLFFLGLGLAVVLPLFFDAKFGSSSSNWVLSLLFGALLFGAGIVAFGSARTKTVFDPSARTITLITSTGRIKKSYFFDNFHEFKVASHKTQILWMVFLINDEKKILSLSGVSSSPGAANNLSQEILSIMAPGSSRSL